MNKISFFLFYIFAWFIAILPVRLQYLFSDGVFVIAYYLIGYRRNVVMQNLKNAFPEKTETELHIIEKKYYQHLVDVFIEVLAMFSLNEKRMQKRHKFINIELLQNLHDKNVGIVGVSGHYNNWEWLNFLNSKVNYIGLAIFKPISNPLYENFMNKIREKFGSLAVSMNNTLREIIEQKRKGKLPFVLMVSDQAPSYTEKNYWTQFLNQETLFFTGVEKIAKKYNFAVVFIKMRKIKRGYYETTFELITEEPLKTEEYFITKQYVEKLEELIKENPNYWLWSHKRWKNKRQI